MRRHSLAGLVIAALLAALVAGGAWAYPETWVAYPRLLAQVRHGPLIRAIINPQRRDVEIKFANKDEWHAYYPAGAQAELQRLIDARHIRLLFVPRHAVASRPAAVHHRLRYVAGGVLVALVFVAGGYLLWRRRRAATASPSAPAG
jgi:hypothetical protein